MKKKIAIITGASGQDGSYLSSFLLKKGYKVIAADRRNSRNDNWRHKYLKIENHLTYEDFDLSERESIYRLFKKYKPNEFYNLGGQSFVVSAFKAPLYTTDVTAVAVLRILEIIREYSPKTKFYQASSSEMFGKTSMNFQNEKTPFYPRSPYAVSKVFGHYITKNYREAYGLFACSGILFNHESPLRGEEFVTRKITKQLCEVIKKKRKIVHLGNIEAKRDWGYAKEYVEAMWKMLQQKKADDYVIATGKTYSIKNFIDESCKVLNLKVRWLSKKGNKYLISIKDKKTILIANSSNNLRPAEVSYLRGDFAKAKKILKWKPKIQFKTLVKIMIQEDLERI